MKSGTQKTSLDFVSTSSRKNTSGVGIVGDLAGLKQAIVVPEQTFGIKSLEGKHDKPSNLTYRPYHLNSSHRIYIDRI